MGVDTPGVDAVEDPFPVGGHRELARPGRFRGKSGAVSDPLPVAGAGQIPPDPEVLPVEGFAGAGPGVPLLFQRGPFPVEVVPLLARQADPGRQRDCRVRSVPSSSARVSVWITGGYGGRGNFGRFRFDWSFLGLRRPWDHRLSPVPMQACREKADGSVKASWGASISLVLNPDASRIQAVGQLLADLFLQAGQLAAAPIETLRVVDGPLGRPGSVEHSENGVVILLADGVELVVVAARARDGETLKRLGNHVDLVVRPLDPVLQRIHRLEPMLHHAEVSRSQEGLVDAQCRVHSGGGEQVACQMLPDQLVVGDVGIQGPNQVVAVTPRVGRVRIAFAAMGLAVADQVHPVAGPVLAELGRVEKLVHQVLVGAWRGVGDESPDLSGEGRESSQIVGEAADQSVSVRSRRRFQSLLLQSGQDEAVHGVQRPTGAGHRGRGDGANRLPGPVAALAGFQVESFTRIRRDRRGIGPGGSHPDPFDEGLDLRIRQGAGGRHQGRAALDAVDQGALVRLAGNDGRSRDTPLDQVVAPVQPQTGERRRGIGAVAFVAVVGQQGTDLFFEEFE